MARVGVITGNGMVFFFLLSYPYFAFTEERLAGIENKYCYVAQATGDETPRERQTIRHAYDLSLAVGNKQGLSLQATTNIGIGHKRYCTWRISLAAILAAVSLLVSLVLRYHVRSSVD